MKHVLIIGCGDIGRRVGRLWRARGHTVSGVVRSAKSAALLPTDGIEALQADLDRAVPALPTGGSLLYYFAPPPGTGQTDPRLRRLLAAIPADALPERLVLISATGVYGDCQGAWVDEASPVRPQVDRAWRRLDAENAVRDWSAVTGVPVVILRVAGIYGPGRLPVEALRAGRPVVREAEAPYSNRIHADDLARACVAAAERGRPGAVYNVSNGQQTTMTTYFKAVAAALGLPPPPEIPLSEAERRFSAGMLSYLAESRRIDNRRMREELGVELLYPTLEAGLAATLEAERTGVPP